MTTLNAVSKMDWSGDLVSPVGTATGGGVAAWLMSRIHRFWDIINVDLGQVDGDDGECYPSGGCCCA